jgi:hypothetical protein
VLRQNLLVGCATGHRAGRKPHTEEERRVVREKWFSSFFLDLFCPSSRLRCRRKLVGWGHRGRRMKKLKKNEEASRLWGGVSSARKKNEERLVE